MSGPGSRWVHLYSKLLVDWFFRVMDQALPPARYSILHASRGRPKEALATCIEWFSATVSPERVEYLIGLDDDDPTINRYREEFAALSSSDPRWRCQIMVTPSRNPPSALNNLSCQISSTSELRVGVSEDLFPHAEWDRLLSEASNDINNFSSPRFFGVLDSEHPLGSYIIYVTNRALLSRLGWVYYPEYDGL